EVPERLERCGIEGDEVSFGVATEHQAAGGGENARPGRRCVLKFLLYLSGNGIDGFEKSEVWFGFFRGEVGAAVKSVAGFVRLGRGAEDVALIARGHVEQPGLRVVSRRHVVGGAERAGADGVSFERG